MAVSFRAGHRDLFAEHGFAAPSTREISDRLGFTRAALCYHFRTKDDLLDTLLAPVIASLGALVSDATPRPSTSARRQVLAGTPLAAACGALGIPAASHP